LLLEELHIVNQAVSALLHAARIRQLKQQTPQTDDQSEETKIEVTEGVFKDKITASGVKGVK
jgi:hypothetical protein